MDKNRLANAEIAGAVLGSLAHPTRLLLVCLLLERERFGQEFLEALGTTKGNISQHLRILEEQGHVKSRKDGNRVYYRIADDRVKKLMRSIQALYCPGLIKP